MARLTVSATAVSLFGDFRVVVSVSGQDGKPTKKLRQQSFKIHRLIVNPGVNAPSVALARPVLLAEEGPNGFYMLKLEEMILPPGHYVFAVAVTTTPRKGGEPNQGQVVAEGDIPA